MAELIDRRQRQAYALVFFHIFGKIPDLEKCVYEKLEGGRPGGKPKIRKC